MNPLLLAGPAVEPVTLAEAGLFLRLDGTDEDDLVAALITSARLTIEAATRLALVAQGWRLTLPGPVAGPVVLPLGPLIGIDAVRVVAGAGMTLLSPAQFTLEADREPARIRFASDAVGTGPVQVDATYGFGPAASDVPASLRLAVKQLVACWFENRGDGPSLSPASLPAGVQTLLSPFARRRLA